MVRVLAADVATTTGVAHDGPTDGAPICQTFKVQTYGDDLGIPYKGYRRWFSDLLAVVQPDLVCFEAPLTLANRDGMNVKTNATTIRLLFGLAAITELCVAEAGIECFEVNVSTWKKQFAGNGHAKKHEVMNRCRMLGWPYRNDHEADASGMWFVTKATRDPQWAPRSTPLFRSAAP